MKRALQSFAFTLTAIFLFTIAAAAAPGNLAFVNGTPQGLTVCQNSSATSINAYLTASDDQAGETLTWSVFLSPAHGTLGGFSGTGTSVVGNNTPTGLTYTPTAGYTGGDVIQIQVSNGVNQAFTQINITVQAAPTPTFITSPGANTCTSTPVTYTTQSGGGINSYSWSVPGVAGTDYTITSGSTGSASSTVTISWITTGSKTVTVNYKNLSGCLGVAPASSTTTVNARPTPTFTSAPSATICGGVNTTYTTQAGQSAYSWSVPGTAGTDYNIVAGGIGSGSNTVTLNWITSGSKTVTVNYNNAAGCAGLTAASSSTIVLARPVATFTTAPGANTCTGTSVTYTTQSGQFSYLWTVPGTAGVDYTITSGSIGSTSNTVTLTWITTGTKTVQVNYSDVNGCTSASDATNTTSVNPRPTPTFTSAPGASTCAGTGVTYTTQSGQSAYTWSVPGTAGTDYTITSGGISSTDNTVTISWITAGSKTVTVNYSTALGCAGLTAASSTTTVNSRPVPTFTTSPVTSCVGTSVTYTTQSGQVSYSWSVPGTAGVDYNITAGGIGSGSNTVTLTWITPGNKTVTVNYVDANGCTGATPATNTITALSVPTVTSASGSSVCAGSTGTVTATPSTGATINWYDLATGGTLLGTGNVLSIPSASATATYYAEAFNTCPSASRTGVTLVVNPLPTPTFTASPAGSICAGTVVTYTTQTGGGINNYAWSVPGTAGVDYTITAGGIGSSSNTVSINWITGGSKTVTVNYNNSFGCAGASPASSTTTVHAPTPTFTSVPASPACSGVNATYTTQAGQVSYSWSVPGTAGVDYTIISGGIGSGSNTVTLQWITTGSKTVTVNYTDAFGCTGVTAASNTSVVSTSPTVISGPLSVCTGSTITLTNGTSGGTWTSSTPAQATVGSATGIVTGYMVGTPSIIYTLPSGCAASQVVTVNQTPTGISGTFSACTGGGSTLTNGYSGGVWTSSATGVATIGSASGVVSAVSPGTSTITYTLPGGCTATVVYTVNIVPAAIGGTTNVCAGMMTTLTDATAGGVWSSSNTSVATIWSGAGIVTGITAGTTTITYMMGTGCYNTTSFTVNPVPAAITGTTNVCAGLTTTLGDATAGGTWTSSATGIAAIGSGTGTVTGVSAGNATISYTIPATGCYSTTAFTVNALPAAIAGTGMVCTGLTATLTDATGGGVWTSSNSGQATIGSSTGVVTGVSAGTPDITYTLSTGCIATTQETINALPATIGGALAVCPGTTTTLTDATGGGVWTSNNTAVATIGSASGIATGITAGTSTITYAVTATGCIRTALLTVNPNPAAISGTLSVCQGSATVLASATGGGTWSSASPFNAAVNPLTGVVAGLTGGTTAVITYSLGTGCIATATVTVNTTPSAIITPAGSAIINLTAGTGVITSGGNGGQATLAGVGRPIGVAVDAAGNTYIAESGNSRVRKISTTGIITTFAGTGTAGFSGDGGPATAATLSNDIESIAIDNAGNLYIADATNARVRMVNTSGIISTIAGGGASLGDGGPATAALFVTPNGLATDAAGNIYISDGGSNRVRKITAGIVTTIAGNGTAGFGGDGGAANAANINNPQGIAVDGTGSLFIADYSNNRVRKVTAAGIISTVTGTGTTGFSGDGGPATAAQVAGVYAVAVDASGTLYLADYSNNRVRTVNAAGIISTLAGNGTDAFTGAGGLATAAAVGGPAGLAVDAMGNVYVSEYDVNRVAKIIPSSVCTGSAITLSDATGGGTWSSSNTALATVAGGVVTGVATGNAIISYTIGGCAATASTTVTAVPAAITGVNNVCVGFTNALSDATGGGQWTSSNTTFASIGSASGIATGNAAGALNIVYTLPTGCAATLPFTVNSTPAAISGANTVCTGTTTVLTDATSGGTWSSSFPGRATVSGGTVTGVAAGAVTISYTTSPGSCAALFPMTVNATPAANTGSATVCTGSTTTLANSTAGGTWASSNTALATVGSSTGIVSGVAVGNPVISYVLSTGCFANTTVTVVSAPAAITGATSVCTGATTTLINTVSGGTWTSSNPSFATIGSASGTVTGVAAGSLNITYAAGSCFVTYAFTVNQTPPAITGSNQVCIGLNNTLSDGIGGGIWTSLAPATASVGSSNGVVTGVTAGTTTIVYTLPAGCTASLPVTVNVQPAAISGSATVCTGASTALTESVSGGTWSTSNGAVATVSGTGSVTGVAVGTVTISYVTSGGCNVVFPMTVNQTPAVIAGTRVVCVGSTSTLTDANAGGIWTSTNTAQASVGSLSGIVSGVAAGTPSIIYTLPGGCTATAPVTVNALPTLFSVTGGGGYCAGGAGLHVNLSNSEAGVNYQLFSGATAVGGPLGGTGAALDFGLITTAGTYTVLATRSSTGCSVAMTGSATISINPLPFAYTVTGGGSYCAGSTSTLRIGLSSSAAFGVSYQLVNGGPVGAAIPGTGVVLDFGIQSAAGTYTIVGTSTTGTGCSNTMLGSAVITINPVPSIHNITGGGSYCTGGSGVHIGVDITDVGYSYQLYNGGGTVGSPLAGSGAALDFGFVTAAGSYTVLGINPTTGCSVLMSGTAVVSVNALPVAYGVTAPSGSSYCSGGAGVPIVLTGSATGVSYQLLNGGTAVGAPVAGTGIALTLGTVTAGTYTVMATGGTGCVSAMTGSITVSINPLPAVFTVTGTGAYCAGGTGLHVFLGGSQAGVAYQLSNTLGTIGSPVTGTGSSIDFGLFTTVSTYTVSAVSLGTGCTSNMTGSAVISTNPLPTAYTMSASGSFCFGGAGIDVAVSGSDAGASYQLYRGATAIGAPIVGTGTAGPDFGFQTIGGTYTVIATNSFSCTRVMTGSTIVTVNPLPVAFAVNGGGSYCAGGPGVIIGLSGSTNGVSYQLFNGSTPGATVVGSGLPINFGLNTTAGAYTVVATALGCTNNMTGSAVVAINPLPNAFSITGGLAYCAGGAGTHIGLSGSNVGINYQLYRGSTPSGSVFAGTGAAIDFGVIAPLGTYSVSATNTATGCVNGMTGTLTTTTNPLPAVYPVSGSGSYCSGGSGVVVTLGTSNTGILYQLYRGTTAVGSPVPGTGTGTLSLGSQTIAGTYTVVAIDGTTGCTSNMTGSATISINPLPAAYSVTGGGGYCFSGTGVPVGLAGSTAGISYQLRSGGGPIGLPVVASGTPFNFGVFTTPGTYTVIATNPLTSCTVNMLSAAVVSVYPAIPAYIVSGGGHYCAGGTGVPVTLSSSAIGTNYQLMYGGVPVGAPLVGTTFPLSFGNQTGAGTYTVVATVAATGCSTTMSSSASIVIDPLPVAQVVTGGGNYCPGGSGVSVGLLSSVIGTNYQLYVDGVPVGTSTAGIGTVLNFGLMTTPGVYTVRATLPTSCTSAMTGSATVSLNPVPSRYALSGGGSYCLGGTGLPVALLGSDIGTSYQLFNDDTAIGSVHAGTGSAISFGNQTAEGSYMVVATSSITSCVDTMYDMPSIVINPLPVIQTITGGGSYCPGGTGVSILMGGSEAGINYQLYNGTATAGSPVPGTGFAIDFGLHTATGVYTVVATNTATLCTSNMTGSDTIATYAPPAAFVVSGGGSYCAGGTGAVIGLGSSATGVLYQLYRGTAAVGVPDTGTGAAITFGAQTTAGIYTVKATTIATGCTSNMTGSAAITVNTLPLTYSVTGGGGYCTGATGVHVRLSGSSAGVNYQLIRGTTTVGSPVAGTSSALDFGVFTTAGSYKVIATATATGCTDTMADIATVVINPLPVAYTVSAGTPGYCSGGTGVTIYIANSELDVNYQLYRAGSPIGTSVAGTGTTALDFGPQTVPGSYTVIATNTTTGCTRTMTGAASFVIYPLPPVNSVTGGGAYCVDGPGVGIGMASTNTGIKYQLYRNDTAAGAPVNGTGSALTFGSFTTAGHYTVIATNATTGCTANMAGSANVSVNPAPVVYTVGGGGAYCTGGAGVSISLSGSVVGTDYRLYSGGSPVGGVVSGTGLGISFGAVTAAGAYTVRATTVATGCTADMAGSATVTINALPGLFPVTGGGNFCPAGTGVSVGLYGSVTGVKYQLYVGTTATGSPRFGTGLPVDFGLQTTLGTYTIVATDTATGCSRNMTGSAAVGNYPLPVAYTVIGGGSYCTGGAGANVGLSGSNSGVSYQLYNTAGAVAGPVYGTGGVISFGNQTDADTYTVIATNSATGCTSNMTGSVAVTISPIIAPSVSITTSMGDTACSGLTAMFSAITVNGGTTPTYQWLINGTLTSADSTYSYMPVNGDVVKVVLTSSAACTVPDSAVAIKTITVLPQIMPDVVVAAVPGNEVCRGTTVTYTATATGGGDAPVYQWKKNGSIAIGTNSPLLSYVPANGDVISCVLTSNYHCRTANTVLSNGITMIIDTPIVPEVTIAASPSNYIVPGETLTFNASVNNAVVAPAYQWYVNNHFVPGATFATYSDNIFTNLEVVKCIVTSGGGCAGQAGTSNTITIHVQAVGVDQAAGTVNVQLLPNPNKGIFTLKGDLGSIADQDVTVEVSNMLGQVIYNGKVAAKNGQVDQTIKLDNLANGMYLLNLRTTTGNKVFHMVVEQ